jgi:hypothetical protein
LPSSREAEAELGAHHRKHKKKSHSFSKWDFVHSGGSADSYDGLPTNIRNKKMHIRLRNKKDVELVKRLAIQKKWTYTKVVTESVRSASQEYLLRGKIATLEFMLRVAKEEKEEKKQKNKQ